MERTNGTKGIWVGATRVSGAKWFHRRIDEKRWEGMYGEPRLEYYGCMDYKPGFGRAVLFFD